MHYASFFINTFFGRTLSFKSMDFRYDAGIQYVFRMLYGIEEIL
jgi:hypothetical protein